MMYDPEEDGVDPIIYEELVVEMNQAIENVLRFQAAATPETCTILGSTEQDPELKAIVEKYTR